jgi:hypothetical protein
LKGSKVPEDSTIDKRFKDRRCIVAWRDLFERAERGEELAVSRLIWFVREGVELLYRLAFEKGTRDSCDYQALVAADGAMAGHEIP